MELSRSDDIYAISFTPENLFIPEMTTNTPPVFLWFSRETVAQINAKSDKWFFTVLVQHQCYIKRQTLKPTLQYLPKPNKKLRTVPLYLLNLAK